MTEGFEHDHGVRPRPHCLGTQGGGFIEDNGEDDLFFEQLGLKEITPEELAATSRYVVEESCSELEYMLVEYLPATYLESAMDALNAMKAAAMGVVATQD